MGLGDVDKRQEINRISLRAVQVIREHLKKLLAEFGVDSVILPPFNGDYGYNCHIGNHTFINHYAYLRDCA